MIILRDKYFSNRIMINRVTSKLDKEGFEDYDISSRVPGDAISISTDLNDLRIYLPLDEEYSQYDIDDFIRSMVPYARTTTTMDRNIYVMKLSAKLTEDQYYRLVKHIIEENEYCVLVDKTGL